MLNFVDCVELVGTFEDAKMFLQIFPSGLLCLHELKNTGTKESQIFFLDKENK